MELPRECGNPDVVFWYRPALGPQVVSDDGVDVGGRTIWKENDRIGF
jgi:hypothetical protein